MKHCVAAARIGNVQRTAAMAGLSPSPRELRSKETSPPSPLLLTSKSLTPRLPPIVYGRTPSSSARPCRAPPPTPKPWSHYHRHCHHTLKNPTQPWRRRYNPNRNQRTRCGCSEYGDMREFLDEHREFLLNYIAEVIPANEVAYCLEIKRRMNEEPTTSVDQISTNRSVRSTSSYDFKLCKGYVQRDRISDSSGSEEMVPTSIENFKVVKQDSIVRVDGLKHRVDVDKHQQSGKSLEVTQPKVPETELKVKKAPAPPESPSKSLEERTPDPKSSYSHELPKIHLSMCFHLPVVHQDSLIKPAKSSAHMGTRTRRLLPSRFPFTPSLSPMRTDISRRLCHIHDVCASLAPPGEDRLSLVFATDGRSLTRRIKSDSIIRNYLRFSENSMCYSLTTKVCLPIESALDILDYWHCAALARGGVEQAARRQAFTSVSGGLLDNSERRRACSPSCIKPRQQHLVQPVLDEHKKNVTSMIEDLVVSIFPEALIEMYLVDLQEHVYCLLKESLEFTSKQHERMIRRVMAGGRPWFLNRRDLPRFTSPPRHMIKCFNKNYNVAFIPLKVNFGSIVVELWIEETFSTQMTILFHSLQQFVSITLPYHQQYQSLLQESQMSAFLLQVAQAVFEEMLSLDQLIKKILEVAQRLVSADRASLFLVDHRNSELVSTVFDLRYEANQDSEFGKKEIRMPINKGIAGHVAMSGETMNIPDAYMDERFNKAVDEATGYHTVSILCMPIKVRGKVLAVVQMVNKRDKKVFGPDDESAFQVFSTFFGLALHHARLYDKIKRKEQKYKVALEVLGYHNTCSEEDVEKILEERTKEVEINYNDFALNPFEVSEIEKCKSILNMFEDLFDMTKFDFTVLTRFVLTVKKNYRKVPYHNFDHGWAVANSMYVMLKNDTDNRFDFNNRLALFVACLCHDLDHRGYTNKFMSEIASPLAAIYTTSTLEHHHFNMTVTILQQDGHNIFYQMSGEEYKDVLDSIRQCILATDLAAFFPNLKKINELVFEKSQFDWDETAHRELVKSFCMTGADLSASAKPFTTQLRTVDIIVNEFYQQGDLERQAGRTPIPMMDRRCQDQVPVCQVGFLSSICLPCYRVLAELFPSTTPMLEMATANLDTWKARAEEVKRRIEEN